MRRLLDFDLVVEALDDGYRTRVIASPAGEAEASLVLPFTDKDLRILVLEVVGSIGRLRRKVRRIDAQERQLIENFGGQLYQALFTGPVGDCLQRSRVTANSRDAGLRIRLRLPGALANVPWEYLYDAQHGFLGLDPDMALVRYLELPEPVQPLLIRPPLRILAMISAPSDMTELDAEKEWGKLAETLEPLRSQGLVEVERLEDGTLAALTRRLGLGEYHVLHFIGHGGYDEDDQDGALALEDDSGKARLVAGRVLRMMIRHRSLRLVVLNACEGSRVAPDDPFSGVAQALARQGIPAVVAMQFEISDPAALPSARASTRPSRTDCPLTWPPSRPGARCSPTTTRSNGPLRCSTCARRMAGSSPGDGARRPTGWPGKRPTGAKPTGWPGKRPTGAKPTGWPGKRPTGAKPTGWPGKRPTGAKPTGWPGKRPTGAKPDRLAAERLGREETWTLGGEQLATGELGRVERRQPATRPRPLVPLLVFGPLILGLPLLILAVKVLMPSYTFTMPWALTMLCSAILGGVMAAVEHQRHRVPVWTAALEFLFAWFLIYALYKLNVGHIQRIAAHLPPLVILAGVGAVVSAVLCQRALAMQIRKGPGVHPLLPAFLICMVVGLGAAAIGYASMRYSAVQILQRIGPSASHIGAAFLFAALVIDLLAPLLALVRKLNGR